MSGAAASSLRYTERYSLESHGSLRRERSFRGSGRPGPRGWECRNAGLRRRTARPARIPSRPAPLEDAARVVPEFAPAVGCERTLEGHRFPKPSPPGRAGTARPEAPPRRCRTSPQAAVVRTLSISTRPQAVSAARTSSLCTVSARSPENVSTSNSLASEASRPSPLAISTRVSPSTPSTVTSPSNDRMAISVAPGYGHQVVHRHEWFPPPLSRLASDSRKGRCSGASRTCAPPPSPWIRLRGERRCVGFGANSVRSA